MSLPSKSTAGTPQVMRRDVLILVSSLALMAALIGVASMYGGGGTTEVAEITVSTVEGNRDGNSATDDEVPLQPEKDPAQNKPVRRIQPAVPIPSDGGLSLVREWLRLNLDYGKWEEVKFWPARPLMTRYQDDIKYNSELAAKLLVDIGKLERTLSIYKTPGDPSVEKFRKEQVEKLEGEIDEKERELEKATKEIQWDIQHGPTVLGRLRYRSANGFGAMVIEDLYFTIEDGQLGTSNVPHETHQIQLQQLWKTAIENQSDWGLGVVDQFTNEGSR